MQLKENAPLARFTTFGIGGPARWLVEAASEEEIVETSEWAREQGVRMFVLGGGSNLLVSDAGFDGLVLRVALRGIAAADAPESAANSPRPPQRIYRAAAGEPWECCVERAIGDGCAGIECLAGIPGTVGGTPVQNVGAYGQEAASVIERVRAFDLRERTFVELSAAECGFAYRRSRFNTVDCGRFIVTRVDYRLTPGGAATLRYADVQRAMEASLRDGAEPSLAEVAAAVRRIRGAKGMLLVEGDPDSRSAGSFFKNPIISKKRLQEIAACSAGAPPKHPGDEDLSPPPQEAECASWGPRSPGTPPGFPAGGRSESASRVKIPAAWLIEQAGFAKGFAMGAAGISTKHTLAIVNRGGARAAEILALADRISSAVEARFGIRLEREPVLVGF